MKYFEISKNKYQTTCDKVVYIKGNACVKNKKEVYDER